LISEFSNGSHSGEGTNYEQDLTNDASTDILVSPELFFMMMNRMFSVFQASLAMPPKFI
jgi:hypothetical protein